MKFIANQTEFKLIMELNALLEDEANLLEATKNIVDTPLPPIDGESYDDADYDVATENVITNSVENTEEPINIEELVKINRTSIIKHNRIVNILNELFDLKGTSKNSYGGSRTTNKPKYNKNRRFPDNRE